MEDALLIREMQQGNRTVFAELVERYKKRIYGFAFKLEQEHHAAEDLAQETFLRAYANLDKFRGAGSFLSWLFAIAVNCYRSEKRKRQLRIVNIESEELLQIPEKEESHHDAGSEDWQAMAKMAIDRLPKKQKLVLVLRAFENLSYQEISEIMGISTESVKANLSYARQTLRNELQEKLL